MTAEATGYGLGLFSIAIGLAELGATRRIARALGSDTRGGRATLKAFGARELLAGAGLLAAPAHSALVWNRVAGDAMDLTALGLAATRAPARKAVWGAIAFVAGALALDIVTARRLDRTTGKTFPTDPGPPPAPVKLGHATSIEPAAMPTVEAPAIYRN
ncbi:hypothetical protein [Sphingobium olei]|uniref:Cyclase dehydrase n=1 Tax=Sphingobium olei TaxID=420955 RepID=A0ABW3P8H1_9SPHN